MIRVLLVDDHPVVRSGLRALLDSCADLSVIAEAPDGQTAVRLAADADVVLMDLRLGDGIDGVDATRQIIAADPDISVIILTTYDHDRDIMRAVEAGAAGYLLKDAPPEVIIAAVREAAHPGVALGSELTRRMVETLQAPRVKLSERELDVLTALARGSSNREISRELFVSEATVKTHLVHIFSKLGADSRTAAVALARQAGLLP